MTAQRGHFERALDVRCPRPPVGCGSAPGWSCTARTGRILNRPHAVRSEHAAALALCREFPDTCAGSGGMGGEGGPCGSHLDLAREGIHPDDMPEFMAQVRDTLRRLW